MRREPFKGRLVIGAQSGLRKLMRAARRGRLPDTTLLAIENASTVKALMRHRWYRRKNGIFGEADFLHGAS